MTRFHFISLPFAGCFTENSRPESDHSTSLTFRTVFISNDLLVPSDFAVKAAKFKIHLVISPVLYMNVFYKSESFTLLWYKKFIPQRCFTLLAVPYKNEGLPSYFFSKILYSRHRDSDESGVQVRINFVSNLLQEIIKLYKWAGILVSGNHKTEATENEKLRGKSKMS